MAAAPALETWKTGHAFDSGIKCRIPAEQIHRIAGSNIYVNIVATGTEDNCADAYFDSRESDKRRLQENSEMISSHP
jgi:hypothetical protein